MAASSREGRSDPVEVIRAAPGRFAVRGPLVFASARRASEAGVRAFSAAAEKDLQVDCSAVTAGDSAGLAVLLTWLAWATRQGVTMRMVHVPEAIRAMARISEVEALLA